MGLPTFLLAIVFVTTASAFNTLVPHDKELIYDYKALVKAGTHFPASFVSQFVLHGKLHVQSNTNSTFVKLTDLSYKLYNGKLDHKHEHEAHDVPMPTEVHELENVFKIVHDETGKAMGIATEDHEKEWSRNIKKAIAGILQLDVHETIKNHHPDQTHHHHHAFVTNEHSIYGYGETDYNVFHHGDEVIIHKMHHMKHTEHLFQAHVNHDDLLHCDMHFEEPITHDSQRKYVIGKHEDHQMVKEIEAVGGIFYHPHHAKSDSQYILVNQTYHLLHVEPLKEHFHMTKEHYVNHLTYHLIDDAVTDHLPDLTHGRHVVDYQKLIPAVQELIHDIDEYMHEDHINTETPNVKHGQSINRVQRLMTRFHIEHFEILHTGLKAAKNTQHTTIFLHLLPIVGSKASTIYMKNMIMQKQITDDEAVELLHHLPTHVLHPTKQLLTEMEELIHHDFSWPVKKAVILAFGTLVHKTHHHQETLHNLFHDYNQDHHHEQEHHSHDIQHDYDKYVVEYVNKVKTSKDFKIQMIYLNGLFNMKLDSIVQHLKPLIMGEYSHHLRLHALWAVAPVVVKDHDLVHEIFWPVFANHHEHTEMRVAAYFYMMESQPTMSRLTNIYWQMLHEPDDEVYHFYYSYIHSMMQSEEPCKHEFKLRLAQIMKYMHPPSHGLSFAHTTDYLDVSSEFSGGLTNLLINTNDSQILCFAMNSQLFYQYHDDWLIYVKVHGHKFSDPFEWSGNHPGNTLMHIPWHSGVHIEVILMKHQQIYNSYYVTETNRDEELGFLLDYLMKPTKETVDNFLHITYERYQAFFMPTDLGMLAKWEYIMPMVEHNKINTQKEEVNKAHVFHIDNTYTEWIHYRHGLTFYNPIADVWHGISRYHSFDSIWPVHFDVSFNPQQQILKISWKKHSNEKKDVMGIKSHVCTMTFVKDDHQKNLLLQSSPHSKQFMVVTHGDQFRNDYPIYHKDDLSTGHLWHMSSFDSGHHVSNGSFQHLLHLFSQPYTKHFESPFTYTYLTFDNLLTYSLYLPKPGTHGFVIRGEPSHHHTVTNIDFSIRMNEDSLKEHFVYTPKTKYSTRITYAVKNKEQSLKTWDMNAILDMNAGHTVNGLKMYLTRIIPGQQDYKICIDGVKKWGHDGVTGHLNVAMSKTSDGKCVNDDTVVDITMVGEKSYGQEHKHHIYGACHYMVPYSIPRYHTLQCLAAHTSVRHYTYNVKTVKMPQEFNKFFYTWWDQIKGYYMWHYTYHDDHGEDIAENHVKIDMIYPMEGEDVDISITTPHHQYQLSGIPTHHWHWMGMTPDTTSYSKWFMYMHAVGLVDHCHVHFDHYYLNDHHVMYEKLADDWVLFVTEKEPTGKQMVYMKHMPNDNIAIKVVDHNHVFEVYPNNKIMIDGKEVQDHTQHFEDWMLYHMFNHEKPELMIAMFHHSGFHLEYYDTHATVVMPKGSHTWFGHCYSH